MKKALITALALFITVGLTACQKPATPKNTPNPGELSQGSSSTGDVALSNTTPNIALEEAQLQQLQTQAVDFAKYFSYAFETTSDIHAEAVGWYTFLKLYEKEIPPTDKEGMSYFAKADVDAYVALRFGIDDFVYPTSGRNDYDHFDAEKQQYVLYMIGEGPWLDIEIVGEERSGNEIEYKINIYNSAMGVEQPEPIFRNQMLYRFEIVRGQDEAILLRAVSATEVS